MCGIPHHFVTTTISTANLYCACNGGPFSFSLLTFPYFLVLFLCVSFHPQTPLGHFHFDPCYHITTVSLMAYSVVYGRYEWQFPDISLHLGRLIVPREELQPGPCLIETLRDRDSEKGEQMVNGGVWCIELRMSGDGSKVFLLEFYSIQAFSTQTGKVLGRVRFKGKPLMGSLTVDCPRVWICSSDLQIQGWDFRTPVTNSSAP